MKIAVLTSGGDAPGMNAAVRAVARTGFSRGWEVSRIDNGYRGFWRDAYIPWTGAASGASYSGAERCSERSARWSSQLLKDRGRRYTSSEAGVDGLVVIGGEGTLTGGLKLTELGVAMVGVPATIDNDVWGTDMAIGVDTALNTAMEAIDRIKDTTSSHR